MVIKNILLILLLFFITGCSSYDQNKEVNIELPREINKINERYAGYVQKNEWEISKSVKLENCENFDFNQKLENIHNKEVKKLLKEIFKNIDFYEYKLNSEEIRDKQYNGQILIFQNKAITNLNINNKSASFKIKIKSKLVVSNFEDETFTSMISASGFGEKKLFLTCKINPLIEKTLKEIFEEFLTTMKSNIYRGISKVNKKY